MNLTERRCKARLQTLRQQGIVPVITGFIGATQEGVLTTLGRGGSDYSATILGAALNADEVIIWTDVNGLMTADPRQVPGACTIPEISYREAAELAYFGAKVLHPKTLRPVMQSGIPLWIRNTFAPERAGTKITPEARVNGSGVKALTAMKDVALITVGGPGFFGVTDVVGRAFATIAAVRADVLLISQSSSRNDICLVVSAAVAKHTVEALRREFAHDLARRKSRAHHSRLLHRDCRCGRPRHAWRGGSCGPYVWGFEPGERGGHRDCTRSIGLQRFIRGCAKRHEGSARCYSWGIRAWHRECRSSSGAKIQ